VGLEQGLLRPCEDKWGATWNISCGSGLEKLRFTTVGIHRADHAPPLYQQKLALNFAKKWQTLSRYSSLAD
jgi:hypothetical protein